MSKQLLLVSFLVFITLSCEKVITVTGLKIGDKPLAEGFNPIKKLNDAAVIGVLVKDSLATAWVLKSKNDEITNIFPIDNQQKMRAKEVCLKCMSRDGSDVYDCKK